MASDKLGDTISLRLPRSVQSVLSERAHMLGITIHQYAKLIVIDEASDARYHRLQDELRSLRHMINELRDDFIFLVSNLLCKQGTFSEQEAKEWVQRHFGNR